MEMEKTDFRISTNQQTFDHVTVSDFGDLVWVSIYILGGHARAILSRDQAREMAQALMEVADREIA
jgi:hypothetical protein